MRIFQQVVISLLTEGTHPGAQKQHIRSTSKHAVQVLRQWVQPFHVVWFELVKQWEITSRQTSKTVISRYSEVDELINVVVLLALLYSFQNSLSECLDMELPVLRL